MQWLRLLIHLIIIILSFAFNKLKAADVLARLPVARVCPAAASLEQRLLCVVELLTNLVFFSLAALIILVYLSVVIVRRMNNPPSTQSQPSSPQSQSSSSQSSASTGEWIRVWMPVLATMFELFMSSQSHRRRRTRRRFAWRGTVARPTQTRRLVPLRLLPAPASQVEFPCIQRRIEAPPEVCGQQRIEVPPDVCGQQLDALLTELRSMVLFGQQRTSLQALLGLFALEEKEELKVRWCGVTVCWILQWVLCCVCATWVS